MSRTRKKYCLYIHTLSKEISNLENDKRYVGITCKSNPEKRWENGYGYRKNKYFFRAIEKYGWDNFKHEIIANDLTHDEACDMEKLFIALYNTKNSNYGYNFTYGGEGVIGHKMSDAEKIKRSIRFKGENNPYYNKKHSEIIREKMSLNHYDVSGGKNPKARKVFKFDLDGNFIKEYECITYAANDNGIADMSIFNAIKEKRQGGNYFWGSEDDVIKKDNIVLKDFSLYRKIIPHEKPVEQYDLNENFICSFISVTKAAEKFNGTRQNIVRAIKNNATAYGYIWKWGEVS